MGEIRMTRRLWDELDEHRRSDYEYIEEIDPGDGGPVYVILSVRPTKAAV